MLFPTPIERQREVVCLPAKGHQVVLGTAGSGKTTMAILRGELLSDRELPEYGRVLFLTYNNALAAYIRSISEKRLQGVTVETYHKFARGYLNSRGLMGYNSIIDPSYKATLVGKGVDKVAAAFPKSLLFERSKKFIETEVDWIAKNGITDLAKYLVTPRIGRGVGIPQQYRKQIWEVREEYLALRKASGFKYDWDDIATEVVTALLADKIPRRYRHIIIDEGQDLSPQMLRSLALAIPSDGSITFFGDVAQQIYGHRVSWRSAGLGTDKVWEFKENYRNSREIAELGLAIAKMDYYGAIPDMVAPTSPKAAGPKPTLVELSSEQAEIEFVARVAIEVSKTRSAAILVRTVGQQREIKKLLPPSTKDLRENNSTWIDGPQIYIGTYHSAKGLEFDAVILPFMSDDKFPDPAQMMEFGQDEADEHDGRLLYVGVTRAKTALILTHVGKPTHLLPSEPNLYTSRKR